MDEHPPVFNYLGEEMMQQHLVDVTRSIQSCFEPGSDQYNKLADYSEKIVQKREKWPEKIILKWQQRVVPVWSSETITKCNQAFTSQIDFANENRKKLQTSCLADINRVKRKIDDIHKKRDSLEEKYNETSYSSQAQIQLLGPRDVHERVRQSTALRSAYDTYMWTTTRLTSQEKTLWNQQNFLEGELAPIKMISSQTNNKHLVITKGNSLIGWLPGEETYVLIQQTKAPPQAEIFRHISHEPDTGLSNLPLSIFNLISFADEIGATDTVLLQMLTIYLKEHKHTLLDLIDTKKRSIAAIMEILAHHCSTESEQQTILQKLRHFKRDPLESFASAVFRFESFYIFYLQLDSPQTADSIRLLSYQVLRQITQYLISPKAGVAFGKWASDTTKVGGIIDKETIIRTVTQLESYADLKLHSPRTLPGTLITTTLGLPAGPDEQTILANYINPQKPVDIKKTSTKKNSSSNSRPNSNNRAKSASKNSRSRPSSRNTSSDKVPNRNQSTSPNNGHINSQRGRGVDKTFPVNSADTMDDEMECLQYYSRYSKSPNEVRKKSIPSIFRRPLTPRSKEHLKKNYFFYHIWGYKIPRC